ncbi:hypothetical protein AAC387_Pa06g0317 [Persea americana]
MLLPIVVIKRVPTSWLRMSSVFAIGRTQHLLPSVPASSPSRLLSWEISLWCPPFAHWCISFSLLCLIHLEVPRCVCGY